MRLKKLEVHGFKSFADKTVIHFDHGITCVVGPNGCGKSNIVDSLRWCMGEQSAKHLRGDGMQDVIFNGSETRGPSGMAEVSLTFVNEGDVSGEFSAYPEITLARRLYRSGESEYLINKQQVRLKDVQDIILGTGVGTKGYSIIEQGRIGMIVSSKPEDRRRLIEEAAGITKYKARRQAAERKMDATRQNLVRVGDLVTELGKRLGVLRRQAARAEKFRALRAELRELELHEATMEHLRLHVQVAAENVELVRLDEESTGLSARLAVMEADGEVARLQLLEDDKRLAELQTQVYQVDQKMRLLEQQATHKEESAQALLARSDEADLEQVTQRGRLGALADERANLVEELARIVAEVENQEEVLAQAAAAVEEARAVRDEDAGRFEEMRLRLQQVAGEATAAQTHLDQLARRLTELEEREARARGEQENLEAEDDAVQNSKRLGNASLGARREEKLELEGQKETVSAELVDATAQLATALAEVNAIQEELGRKRQKLHALEELHQSLGRAPEGVRTVMAWSREGKVEGVLGVLGDAVEAPAQFEAAVAGALGPHLDDVVVLDTAAGVEVARRLSREGKGRATLLPLTARNAHGARTPVDEEGCLGWLLDHLTIEERMRAAVEARLGNALMVKDLGVAQRLFDAGVAARMVTQGGDVMGLAGDVVGGTADEAAQIFLRQKREIHELTEESGALEQKMHASDDVRAALHFKVETLRTRERDLVEELQTVALRLVEAEKDLHRLADQEERLKARQAALTSEMTRIQELLAELRMEDAQHRETLTTTADERERLEMEMQSMTERLNILNAQFQSTNERALELKVRAQSAQARREQVERGIKSAERAVQEVEEFTVRLGQQALAGREQAAMLVGQATVDREEALRLGVEVAQLRTAHEADRVRYEEAQHRVAAMEVEARALRHHAQSLSNAVSECRLALREHQLALEHLHARILEVYQTVLTDVLYDFHMSPPLAGNMVERAVELRRQLDGMGEINLTAIDECRDVEERHTFLCNQQDDLHHALNQLERAITKINKTTRRRFQEAFESINEKFQAVFPRLFRGGKAWLQLTEPENLLETGVEIFAQPPGKKVSTVQLLSGGEKALTAVSLVFSIFLIKPSPFCLLDEVDAPLDEANVSRFNELVRDVSSLSQFIIITHNKRTMEIADNLYGITMEQPGVSKLVNVRVNLAALPSAVGSTAQLQPAGA